jgi:hypothetical protein
MKEITPQIKKDIRGGISNVLDSLLIYKMAAKLLSEEEIETILSIGGQNFAEYYLNTYDQKDVSLIVDNAVKDKKQLIMNSKGVSK